jgi:hypothetical protein
MRIIVRTLQLTAALLTGPVALHLATAVARACENWGG